jgi:hypothetical protein
VNGDDDSSTGKGRAEILQQGASRLVVKALGRLVEQQQAGVPQVGLGDAQLAPLAAGEPLAARADLRDGLHPTAAGSACVAGQVAAILCNHGVRPARIGAGAAPGHLQPDQRPSVGLDLRPNRSAVAFGHLADDGQPFSVVWV